MDKKAELEKLHSRAFALRMPMYKICEDAGVAASTISRWNKNPDTMTARPLSKIETVLDKLESAKAT